MHGAPPDRAPTPPVTGRRGIVRAAAGSLIWTLLALLLVTCSPPKTELDKLRELGVLRVATINSPTSYFTGLGGVQGFDHDVAELLAAQLGLSLRFLVVDSIETVIDHVRRGRAHVGAVSMAVTPERRRQVLFTQPLRSVQPQLVYRLGRGRPREWRQVDAPVHVSRDSGLAALLEQARAQHPELQIVVTDEHSDEDLLRLVAEEQIDYAVALSDLVAINRRYYPQLGVAFDVAGPTPLSWAVTGNGDRSLLEAVDEFLAGIDEAELARIKDRYFGHLRRINAAGALTLARHVKTRLPRYREHFERAAAQVGIDWRLLAAVGYQESHWNPRAVSPTGVRGIMQITQATAEFLGLENRLDPEAAIYAAARYIRMLHDRLPERIPEPDRTWMALAAYNIGLGHLEDARILTQRQGGNPDRWIDVRARLPLLTQKKYYQTLPNGYARGHEAVTYVGNIRTYYDMLVWLTGEPEQLTTPEPPGEDALPEEPEDSPLNIDNPLL